MWSSCVMAYRSGMGKFLYILLVSISVLMTVPAYAQDKPVFYHQRLCTVYSLKSDKFRFKVVDINISRGNVKAGYLSPSAGSRYKIWLKQDRRSVICVLAVGFATAFDTGPMGLSMEAGKVVNANMSAEMDGLVTITSDGSLSAMDIDHEKVSGRYSWRSNADRSLLINRYKQADYSVFQTQLLYTQAHGFMSGEAKYGKQSSRRFLAICQDAQHQTHHLILDLVASAHLNAAAHQALNALQDHGFTVQYLLNQDTGGMDIMELYDDRGKPVYAAPVALTKATQLLVYYYY